MESETGYREESNIAAEEREQEPSGQVDGESRRGGVHFALQP